jgi:uncharacterized protein YbbK (DUF523 family)
MIVVSACLAGVECRYNAQAFAVPAVMEMVKKGRAIPLCPEVLGNLPIPRPCAEQRDGRIICADGRDLTVNFTAGAERAAAIAGLAGCQKAVLKSKSPSCGCGKIYDGTFSGKLVEGDGVFCKLLRERNITVYTETEVSRLL